MSYNSYNSYNSHNINAKSNYTSFQRQVDSFTSLGDDDKLFSNLKYAEGLIKSLLADCDIEENDVTHGILRSSLNNMSGIYVKPNKSLEDISNFYNTYGIVQDIHKKLRGEQL